MSATSCCANSPGRPDPAQQDRLRNAARSRGRSGMAPETAQRRLNLYDRPRRRAAVGPDRARTSATIARTRSRRLCVGRFEPRDQSPDLDAQAKPAGDAGRNRASGDPRWEAGFFAPRGLCAFPKSLSGAISSSKSAGGGRWRTCGGWSDAGAEDRDHLHRARLIDSREDPAASGTTAGTDSDKPPFWFLSRFWIRLLVPSLNWYCPGPAPTP